jgi:hypothetical protein
MKKILFFLLLAFISKIVFSQTILDASKPHENGDKLSYKLKVSGNGKIFKVEISFLEVGENLWRGQLVRENKIFQISANAYGTVANDVCLSSGQKCDFDPPMKLFDKNIKVNDQWVNKFKVTGEDFVSNTVQEVKVEKQEKLKLDVGEFEAFKIVTKAKFEGTTIKNEKFSGTDLSELWVGNIMGKLVLLRVKYSNSFKEYWNLELDSLPSFN